MTDIAAFPTIHRVLYAGNNIISLTASGDIVAGQVVAIDATGASMVIRAGIAEATEMPIGVAIYDAADGEQVAIATIGTICYVAVADQTTGADAGDFLETNDAAVGGTVSVVAVAATGGATVTCHNAVIGVALDIIAGGGTGRMLVTGPGVVVQPNTS